MRGTIHFLGAIALGLSRTAMVLFLCVLVLVPAGTRSETVAELQDRIDAAEDGQTILIESNIVPSEPIYLIGRNLRFRSPRGETRIKVPPLRIADSIISLSGLEIQQGSRLAAMVVIGSQVSINNCAIGYWMDVESSFIEAVNTVTGGVFIKENSVVRFKQSQLLGRDAIYTFCLCSSKGCATDRTDPTPGITVWDSFAELIECVIVGGKGATPQYADTGFASCPGMLFAKPGIDARNCTLCLLGSEIRGGIDPPPYSGTAGPIWKSGTVEMFCELNADGFIIY